MDTVLDAQSRKRSLWISGISRDDTVAVMSQVKSGLLHDFNNMIGIIMGNAAIAFEQLEPGHPGFEELQEIVTAASRARHLARHLLSLGRGMEFSKSLISVNDIVEKPLSMLKRTVPGGISFNMALSPDTLHILGDQYLLEQVVVNLCKNAIHAMPDGGKLMIKTQNINGKIFAGESIEKQYAVIKVFDTGHGIPKNHIKRVFEPFYSTKPQDQGTGLGLFISRFIVQNHGGSLHVNSIPGTGTIFSIYLPTVP
jgi:signal transduction histidine kinase